MHELQSFGISVLCADSGAQVVDRQSKLTFAELKDEVVSRGSQAGFLQASPCHYCKTDVKKPGSHLKNCVVLFHASLLDLLIKVGHGATDGNDAGLRDEGERRSLASPKWGSNYGGRD